MKNVLIGIGVLLAALVAVALVVPNFVDLNRYKSQVTSQVRAITGRDLVIAGDIELSVIPSIALKADDIRLSNVEGASAADMVALKGLRVRVALLPLLGGDVQVESVIFSEPVIEIELFADGGTNLDFRPEAPAGASEAKPDGEAGAQTDNGAVSEPDQAIRLDSVVIENGTVIFRDQAAGTVERIENLDLTLKATSLKGPFEAEGSMTARGLPLELALKTGRMGVGPMAVAFSLGATEDRGRLRFNGVLSEMGPTGELSGRLEAESRDLRALLAALMPGEGGATSGLPAGLAQPFNLQSSVLLSQFGGNLGDMELALGETRATGALNLALADQPRADLALVVGTMDLDALLAGEASGKAGGDATTPAPPATALKAESVNRPDASGAANKAAAGLPKGMAASVDLIVDAVAYNGAVLRNLRANAVLDNGEITVNQIGASLPGGSELSVFGFVGLPDGQPRFEGTVELASDNARALLEWLKVDVAAVPADRLRKLDLAATVIATAEQVQLSDTRVALDSSTITGGVTVALRDRPAFGLSVNLDRINIDAYMPVARAEAAAAAKPANGAAAGAKPGGAGVAEKDPEGLNALAGFDANIKARIGRLTYNDVPVRGVAFDGTLYDGLLTVNGFSVEDLAGAQAAVAGTVGGFGGTPTIKGTVDLSAADIGPLAQLAGVELPIPAAQIGAVALKGSADTDGNRVTMDMKLDAAGGKASVAGTVSDLATAPRYDVTIGLNHPQPARLFALVPGGTPPSLNELEALGLRASLKGGPGGAGGQDMTVDAALQLAGGSMTGKGKISGLGAVLAYDLDISADFPDFVRLVRAISPDYRPAGQNLGGLKLLAALEGNETAAKLSTFQGSVGPVNLKGKGSVDLTGSRPRLIAEIS
ncbi:MAG: AsmA family protein, partial [Proteobacteria bacterium]|nr:AsmA family protein [Pseudomonadota bacterium]